MKKIIVLFVCLLSLSGYCNYNTQQVVLVNCDSSPDITFLSKCLSEGWRIVNSTPITKSKSEYHAGGSVAIVYTSYIIYIIEKEIVEDRATEHKRTGK